MHLDPLNLFGLGPKGQPLDIPVPSEKLPKKVRGRLQRIAYGCGWLAAWAGLSSARQCPSKECPVWSYRMGEWKAAETATDPESELVSYLDGLTGGAPPEMRLGCHTCPSLPRCKLPNCGTYEGVKTTGGGGCVSSVQKLDLTHLSVTCAVCGRSFPTKRPDAKFCSARCRKRASRKT